MKWFAFLSCAGAINASALTIDQDKGRLDIEIVPLEQPFEVTLEQPKGCPEDTASLTQSANGLVVRHGRSCDGGAVVKVKIKAGQDVKASLGTGALMLRDFANVVDQYGQVDVYTRVGSARVPSDMGFTDGHAWFVGKAYSRSNAGVRTLDLRVNTGALEIKR